QQQQHSYTPPPVDRSQFIECQVEVRQIGTSIKSTRQSRFLQRRRLISYAEICEYPLVVSIDFYYISGFVPRLEMRCPTMERTCSHPPDDDDLYFDDDYNELSHKLQQQQQEYLERRRRSKHFWYDQLGNDDNECHVNDNNNQSTSDYHEEDDGEYRENSYDNYLLDDDNDVVPASHRVRFADQIDCVSFVRLTLR
ncbi:hypothetical protein BLA29_006371, partial [Euroglyphus maynei]